MISVIIPCFNIELYIDQCLSSFQNQTYRDFEVICVDDGSTDGTTEIITRYTRQDKRFKLIIQNNQYAGVARNNGMKSAEGEYLLFFDGDDFCEPDMLSELVLSAEKNDSDIVLCDADCFNNLTQKTENDDTFLHTMYLHEFEARGFFSASDVKENIFSVIFP